MKKHVLAILVSACSAAWAAQPVAIDFSHAGYGGAAQAAPALKGTVLVKPVDGDDTALVQAALDHVASLPLSNQGFRGVVVLAPGRFDIGGQLRMRASGVVLRGSGAASTVLQATGQSRRTVILAGAGRAASAAAALPVEADAAAGARTLTLARADGLAPGQRVVVRRPSTAAWIRDLGMDALPGTFAEQRYHWKPGARDLLWDRRISAIDPRTRQVTLDAPITTALEQRYGGATLAAVSGDEPVERIGIEHLTIRSSHAADHPRDEEHAWMGIELDHVEDAWVRHVHGRRLVSSLVRVGARGRRITIEHCDNAQPVGEPGGYRRMSYWVDGQQVLVRASRADLGVNDFAIGLLAAGPNVFLDVQATNAVGDSGSFESWASGVLYENVRIDGAGLRLPDDGLRAGAGGWTAANSVVWNSRAKSISVGGPAGAPNQLVRSGQPLFARQLAQRTGASPAAWPAAPQEAVPVFRPGLEAAAPAAQPVPAPLSIRNGRFVIGERTLWGGAVNDAWWLGKTSPGDALDAGVSISRFVPGRSGPGLTEDLPELAARVAAQGTPFHSTGPAIWYDRRRDDHTILTRQDANVWGAFYELPWARSGKGTAQDGLSKYDLTRYNPWYFERMRTFAALARRHGFVMYHHLYNNHNLLETASHWADYPWRPANNINDTGLPEPIPLEPGEKVHVANQFYDVDNPKLRALHRAYILHVLDQLGGHENVVFGLSFQYSGPLAFQKFFGEVVAEWEARHGRRVKLMLDTAKDITDAILADPERAKQIAVIDMRYWHYLPDGSLWAPKGGQNRAFRELHPREFGDPSTPELVYRQVREYRAAHPDKAIVAWHSGVGAIPALMAGGAQVLMRNPTAGHGQGRQVDRQPLDTFVQQHLASHLADMGPRDGVLADAERNWMLADDGFQHVLLYSRSGTHIVWERARPAGAYRAVWFDPRTGAVTETNVGHAGAIEKPDARDWLVYLRPAQGI